MDNTYTDNKRFEYMNNQVTVGMSIHKYVWKPHYLSWICHVYWDIIRFSHRCSLNLSDNCIVGILLFLFCSLGFERLNDFEGSRRDTWLGFVLGHLVVDLTLSKQLPVLAIYWGTLCNSGTSLPSLFLDTERTKDINTRQGSCLEEICKVFSTTKHVGIYSSVSLFLRFSLHGPSSPCPSAVILLNMFSKYIEI